MDFSKHGNGTTSVKVHHAPGGQSSFSLAWGEPTPASKPKAPVTNTAYQAPLKETNQIPQAGKATDTKTSVKVHNPPGGRSNIIFG
jgi:hypothetical protein